MSDLPEQAPSSIDWTVFDKHPVSDTCTCVCGARFRSHAKATYTGEGKKGMGIWSKEPCPACDGHRLQKIESDPELFTLRGRD